MKKTKVCTKCGQKKILDDFYERKDSIDNRQGICIICFQQRAKQYYKNNKEFILKQCKQYQETHKKEKQLYDIQYRKDNYEKKRQYNRKYYTTLRQQWLNFLHADQTKCAVCGYNQCWAALDFHHNDPGAKDFEISTYMQKAFNEKNRKIFLKELGKCICMCKNCHAEFHAVQRQLKQEETK